MTGIQSPSAPLLPFSPSLISLMVSVDVKHHVSLLTPVGRAEEVCESRGGRPGLPVPNTFTVYVSKHGA